MSDGPEEADHDPETPFGREFDPAERRESPEDDLGPRVEIPAVDAPNDDETDTDIDPDLAARWWGSVVLANVALGGVAVGAMVVFFRGQWELGGLFVLVGVVAAAGLVRIVRRVERERDDNA